MSSFWMQRSVSAHFTHPTQGLILSLDQVNHFIFFAGVPSDLFDHAMQVPVWLGASVDH
jgi:hypothetical protein